MSRNAILDFLSLYLHLLDLVSVTAGANSLFQEPENKLFQSFFPTTIENIPRVVLNRALKFGGEHFFANFQTITPPGWEN